MFHTPLEARRFFEDKIIKQAHDERIPLSADERLMLSWSESEPDSIGDPALVDRLAIEISDEDYEEKILARCPDHHCGIGAALDSQRRVVDHHLL